MLGFPRPKRHVTACVHGMGVDYVLCGERSGSCSGPYALGSDVRLCNSRSGWKSVRVWKHLIQSMKILLINHIEKPVDMKYSRYQGLPDTWVGWMAVAMPLDEAYIQK